MPMAIALSSDQVRHLRLRAQRLMPQASGASAAVSQVVQEMCGIQAQDASAAALALRTRTTGLLAADVERARIEERSIVRTWGPRGTLHLLAAQDLSWLLALFGPHFIAADRRRREELGLDEDTCLRGMQLIQEILVRHQPLTRVELVEQLAWRGLPLEGQARPHLFARAALAGLICFGPDRGAEPTYALLSDMIERGKALPQQAALMELALRFLGAYGPAAPGDLAAWSGLPMSKIRPAWQAMMNQLAEVEIAGRPAWMLPTRLTWLDEPVTPGPIVRLLPRFDIYLLGYQNRSIAVSAEYANRINAGGGIVHPTLLIDGRAAGIWRSKQQRNRLEVQVALFAPLAPEVQRGIEAEVADLARFLEMKATLQVLMP